MPLDLTGKDWNGLVPLFPLPGLILLPRAVAALHIFEPRYREMTRDAAAGRGEIAMALPMPGEDDPGVAPLQPMVCIGRIVRLEPTSDGRFNLLLQGVARATIVAENFDRSYRQAALRVADPGSPTEADREAILQRLESKRLRFLPNLNVVRDMLREPDGLSDAIDVLAAHAIAHVGLSEQLLLEPDVQRRSALMIEVLDSLVDPTGGVGPDFDPSVN